MDHKHVDKSFGEKIDTRAYTCVSFPIMIWYDTKKGNKNTRGHDPFHKNVPRKQTFLCWYSASSLWYSNIIRSSRGLKSLATGLITVQQPVQTNDKDTSYLCNSGTLREESAGDWSIHVVIMLEDRTPVHIPLCWKFSTFCGPIMGSITNHGCHTGQCIVPINFWVCMHRTVSRNITTTTNGNE